MEREAIVEKDIKLKAADKKVEFLRKKVEELNTKMKEEVKQKEKYKRLLLLSESEVKRRVTELREARDTVKVLQSVVKQNTNVKQKKKLMIRRSSVVTSVKRSLKLWMVLRATRICYTRISPTNVICVARCSRTEDRECVM